MLEFDDGVDVTIELGLMVLSGFDDGAAATNRLLLEDGNGLLLEDGSGDLALES